MTLTWFGWLYLAMTAVSIASLILSIGKPRDPVSPGLVLTTLVVSGIYIWGLLTVGMTA